MKLACPACSQIFPPDNINVRTDLALCPACGRIARPSGLSDAGFDENALGQPPKGSWYRQAPTETVVGATTRHGIAIFLVPFGCLWSGGSLGGIYGSQIKSGNFNLFMSLFGLPFLVGSIVLWSIALMAICGKVEVRLRGRQGVVFTGIGPVGWKRPLDLDAVDTIAEEYPRMGRSAARGAAIVLKGSRSQLRFGTQLSDTRRRFILNALKLHKAGKV